MGVPGANQLLGGHEHQRVGPLQLGHGGAKGVLDGGGGQPLLGDDIGDDLGVAGAVEDGPGQLQFIPELGGVAQVAVVGQCHAALLVVDLNGLAVAPVGGPGGAVTGVAHRHSPLGEPVQHLAGEHLPYQPQVLVGGEDPVVIDYNAAALLSPVLEGIQAVVGQPAHISGPGADDAKDAALLMNTHRDTSVLI